jgi:hypothetical protein
MTFTKLLDNTNYIAYFTAENDLPVNPDLIDDESIIKVINLVTSD